MIAVDLFSGCGGLSTGLHKAGFKIAVAVENEQWAAKTYKLNHKGTVVLNKDIEKVSVAEIKKLLGSRELDLLAGCPPCQGFSSMRRRNKNRSVRDNRNSLILQFVRFAKALKPKIILMENVAWLESYYLFKTALSQLSELGYDLDYKVVNAKDYGAPQSRKRLVLVGSRISKISVAKPNNKRTTVKDVLKALPPPSKSNDPIHKIYAIHSEAIFDMIKLIPKNGGSRAELPKKYILECHKVSGIGFNDVYGRLAWNEVSGTITGGCLNPSKGRFLHPEANRCITAREAALLQTFPKSYKFPKGISKERIALLIGNAFPPKLSYYQGLALKKILNSSK